MILHGILRIEIARSFYNLVICNQLDFHNSFSPKLLLLVHSWKCHSFFYVCCIFPETNFTSHPIGRFLINQKMLLVLTCLENQSQISSTLLPSFSFNVSIDNFLLETSGWFVKIMKVVFHIGLGVLIDRVWQKFFYCWLILIFQNNLCKNTVFDFVYQGLNWWWHLSECFLDWTNFDCAPRIGRLVSWTRKKAPIMFLVSRFSSWLSP